MLHISCNIGTRDLPDSYALSPLACNPQAWAYISGKSLMPMLQLLQVHYLFICLVPCTSLTKPDNGVINCSLGDDGVPSYEDTCSITCNTGYELTGSDTRTCQSDGSWSGSDVACRRGR